MAIVRKYLFLFIFAKTQTHTFTLDSTMEVCNIEIYSITKSLRFSLQSKLNVIEIYFYKSQVHDAGSNVFIIYHVTNAVRVEVALE